MSTALKIDKKSLTYFLLAVIGICFVGNYVRKTHIKKTELYGQIEAIRKQLATANEDKARIETELKTFKDKLAASDADRSKQIKTWEENVKKLTGEKDELQKQLDAIKKQQEEAKKVKEEVAKKAKEDNTKKANQNPPAQTAKKTA